MSRANRTTFGVLRHGFLGCVAGPRILHAIRGGRGIPTMFLSGALWDVRAIILRGRRRARISNFRADRFLFLARIRGGKVGRGRLGLLGPMGFVT